MAVGRPDVFDRRDKRPVSSRFARSQAVKSANQCETRYPLGVALEQTFSSRCRNSTRGASPKRGDPRKLHSRKTRPPARPAHDAQQDWWSQTGSNRRPPACKAGALPTELWPRVRIRWCSSRRRMVGPGRLELPTSRLSGVRSNHLSYGPPDPIVPVARAYG